MSVCKQIDWVIADLQKLKAKARRKFTRWSCGKLYHYPAKVLRVKPRWGMISRWLPRSKRLRRARGEGEKMKLNPSQAVIILISIILLGLIAVPNALVGGPHDRGFLPIYPIIIGISAILVFLSRNRKKTKIGKWAPARRWNCGLTCGDTDWRTRPRRSENIAQKPIVVGKFRGRALLQRRVLGWTSSEIDRALSKCRNCNFPILGLQRNIPLVISDPFLSLRMMSRADLMRAPRDWAVVGMWGIMWHGKLCSAGVLAGEFRRRPAVNWWRTHRDGAGTRSRGRLRYAVAAPLLIFRLGVLAGEFIGVPPWTGGERTGTVRELAAGDGRAT